MFKQVTLAAEPILSTLDLPSHALEGLECTMQSSILQHLTTIPVVRTQFGYPLSCQVVARTSSA